MNFINIVSFEKQHQECEKKQFIRTSEFNDMSSVSINRFTTKYLCTIELRVEDGISEYLEREFRRQQTEEIQRYCLISSLHKTLK
jgi:hypothetical protein